MFFLREGKISIFAFLLTRFHVDLCTLTRVVLRGLNAPSVVPFEQDFINVYLHADNFSRHTTFLDLVLIWDVSILNIVPLKHHYKEDTHKYLRLICKHSKPENVRALDILNKIKLSSYNRCVPSKEVKSLTL